MMISILMPYYNKELYIKESINSVIDQSFKDFELIIIYDDETKKDLDYIKSLKKMDKRIRLIINQKNLGAGLSRNRGIEHAKGKYIAFIDSDDLWRKDKLKKQIFFMKKNSSKISCTSFVVIDQQGKIQKEKIVKEKYSFKDILTDCPIGLSSVMVKKSIFNKEIIFPNLKTKEDYVLWLKISKFSEICGIKSKLTYWRNVDNSLSKNISQKLLDGYRVYRIHMNFSVFKSICYLILLSINYVFKNR